MVHRRSWRSLRLELELLLGLELGLLLLGLLLVGLLLGLGLGGLLLGPGPGDAGAAVRVLLAIAVIKAPVAGGAVPNTAQGLPARARGPLSLSNNNPLDSSGSSARANLLAPPKEQTRILCRPCCTKTRTEEEGRRRALNRDLCFFV